MTDQLKSKFKVISQQPKWRKPGRYDTAFVIYYRCLLFTNNGYRVNLKMLRQPSILPTPRGPLMTNKLNALRALSGEKIRLYKKEKN